MKTIIEELEKIAEKHGADELRAAIEHIKYPDVTTQDGPIGHECAEGYYWNETLKACVLDVG